MHKINMHMQTSKLIKIGSVVAAISSIVGATYAGASWIDNRYAKSEEVTAYKVETCKKIEQLALGTVKIEIFKLDVKKAEAARMPKPSTNTPGTQWFSAVDEALLERFKQEEQSIKDRIKQCDDQIKR